MGEVLGKGEVRRKLRNAQKRRRKTTSHVLEYLRYDRERERAGERKHLL